MDKIIRVLALCLLLCLPLRSAIGRGGQAKHSRSPVVELPKHYCSTFSSTGESLSVTVDGSDLKLEITPLVQVAITLHFSLNETDVSSAPGYGPQSCSIFVSASNQLAAIGLREMVRQSDNKRSSLTVLVNLETSRFENRYFIEPCDPRSFCPGLVGFLGNTDSLVIVSGSGAFQSGAQIMFQVADTTNGAVRRMARNLDGLAPVRDVFFNSRDNLIWVELDLSSDNHRHTRLPVLQSINLVGDEKPGPSLDLAKLHHEPLFPKWVVPPAMAFPTPTTTVLAETGWALGFAPSHLWVADLGTGSARALEIPKDIGMALLHGLGLTWIENVKGPAVVSPDGHFAVIPVGLTTIGPPYFVDNYVAKGSRLVVVDIQRMRILASAAPEHDREPIGFALDHRDGEVTLLVNWQEDWKRLQFADSK